MSTEWFTFALPVLGIVPALAILQVRLGRRLVVRAKNSTLDLYQLDGYKWEVRLVGSSPFNAKGSPSANPGGYYGLEDPRK
ncbi:hypothetical protein M407DRAFT_34832 [Tulasnella calospora MUT 4182]|uniref:Uncharacterized protein n=1 Tax=Tulasnella calospora MUT 4182 TaxID=1051891 RepID=A0A0C3Q000_9AGAM|nr:hypothetical protein M407DRAFT_34832 [Tulasnella calospora MUT 4182]